MDKTPSTPSGCGRILLATVLLVSLVAVAGCSTTDEYTTEIGDPSNKTVIESLAVVDINEMDGAQYELHHRLNASENTPYTVEVYERTDDGTEITDVSSLNSKESVYRNDVAPPWDAGETRRYELRVVNGSNDAVVDSINFTITKERS